MPEPDKRVYLLLQQAAHRMRVQADRRCLTAAGVTAAQVGALFALRERPGRTQRDLAAALGQHESAVTAMIGRLLAAGLVRREPSRTDHRARELHLTEAGERALELVRPEMTAFNAQLSGALGEDGFLRLAELLSALNTLD